MAELVGAGGGHSLDVWAPDFCWKKAATRSMISFRGVRDGSGKSMELIDTRNAAHHVLEAGFVGLVIGTYSMGEELPVRSFTFWARASMVISSVLPC